MTTATATKAATLRAAVYCRISDDTEGEAKGVKRQQRDCVAWCQQHGYDVADVYVDNSVSAWKPGRKRPAYSTMLAAVERGEVDVIVCWEIDRLYRQVKDLIQLTEVVTSRGAMVTCVMGGNIDLNTAAGRLAANILGSAGQHESDVKSERICRKFEELREEGKVLSGRTFGWSKDNVVIEDEAALIRQAVDRLLRGESLRGICAEWNAQGVKTARADAYAQAGRRVPRWSTLVLRRMLRNPRLYGVFVSKGVTITVPPILDRKTFDKVGAVLGARTNYGDRKHSHNNAPKRLLSGAILRCGNVVDGHVCDGAMAGAVRPDHKDPAVKVLLYRCNAQAGGCGRMSIDGAKLDALVTDEVFDALSPKQVSQSRGKAERAEVDIRRRLNAAQKHLDDLAEDHGAGVLDRREYALAKAKATERLRAVEAEYADTAAVLIAPTLIGDGDLREAWETFTMEQRRAIVAAAVERITVNSARTFNRFDNERVVIEWRQS